MGSWPGSHSEGEAELECRRSPVSLSFELRLPLRSAGGLFSSSLIEVFGSWIPRLNTLCCDGWLRPTPEFPPLCRTQPRHLEPPGRLPSISLQHSRVCTYIFSPRWTVEWGQDFALTGQGLTEGKSDPYFQIRARFNFPIQPNMLLLFRPFSNLMESGVLSRFLFAKTIRSLCIFCVEQKCTKKQIKINYNPSTERE